MARLVTQPDPHLLPEWHIYMKRIATAAVLSLGIVAGSSGQASADGMGINIGTLECIVEGGIGLIITSSKAMDCVYKSASGREDVYIGKLTKFGLDIGVMGEARMIGVYLHPVLLNMVHFPDGMSVHLQKSQLVLVPVQMRWLVGPI